MDCKDSIPAEKNKAGRRRHYAWDVTDSVYSLRHYTK